MKRAVLIVATFAVLMTGLQEARAEPLYSITGGSDHLGDPPFTLGFDFTPNVSGTVTDLGIYAPTTLADSHTVGLWNSSGTLLASTTFASGTSASAGNLFEYAAISPVNLVAGQTYFIGALYTTGNDNVIFSWGCAEFYGESQHHVWSSDVCEWWDVV